MNKKIFHWGINNPVALVGATVRGIVTPLGAYGFGLEVELPEGGIHNVWIDPSPESAGHGADEAFESIQTAADWELLPAS